MLLVNYGLNYTKLPRRILELEKFRWLGDIGACLSMKAIEQRKEIPSHRNKSTLMCFRQVFGRLSEFTLRLAPVSNNFEI